MTKEQLTEKIGEANSGAEYKNLIAKLQYESGIPSFDNYLDGKTLKQIGAVIHLTKHVKGLAIKIAKNFSSFSFGLTFDEIKRASISENENQHRLIFETEERYISFSLKPQDVFEAKYFLKGTLAEEKSDDITIDIIQEQVIRNPDTDSVPAYIATVSAILVALGCFMPWIQLGALFQNRGMDNPDGAIMLVTAVVAGAVAVFNLSKKENKNLWVFILAGLIGGAVFYFDITELNSRVASIKEGIDKLSTSIGEKSDVSPMNFMGSGLYIVLLGSVGFIISGLRIFKEEKNKSTLGLFTTQHNLEV